MDRCALQHTLEAGGRLRFVVVLADDVGELVVDVIGELALQLLDVEIAGAHHRDGVLVVGQGQQQMFKGCVIVPALVGISEGAVQGLFERRREHRASFLSYAPGGDRCGGRSEPAYSFSIVHWSGC